MAALTPDGFRAATGVSRETLDRLILLADILCRWQTRINLVGPATVTDLWRRHFLDSAQLVPLLPQQARLIADLGSGAGFPGLVLSVMTGIETLLVESDSRKAAFLREAARVAGAPARVHCQRIERGGLPAADVVTARALAPLARLLGLAAPLLKPGGVGLFLKGAGAAHELTEAAKEWHMSVERIKSRTDPAGVILRVEGLFRDRSS